MLMNSGCTLEKQATLYLEAKACSVIFIQSNFHPSHVNWFVVIA